MPVFHNKYNAPGEAPTVYHPELLQAAGPMMQVQLEAPPALVNKLTSEGSPAPSPINGPALVDTGASVSCVDRSVPARLGLSPIGTTQLSGATGGGLRSLYPMRIVVQGMGNWTLDFQYVVEADLAPLGYVALLGRDVLRFTVLQYFGHVGEFTVSM